MNPTRMPVLPLVGRETELGLLYSLLDDAGAGRGRTLWLCSESGLGKSRLVKAATDEAARRNWQVAVGRGYPVETGVPYAPFSDALLPLLRGLSPEALAVLTRGGEAELYSLFPALRPAEVAPRPGLAEAAEFKARMLWNFTQFLCRLAAKHSLLLVIEDLQWADASSLELLHFTARQLGAERVALLCTHNADLKDRNPTLHKTEQSLLALDAVTVHQVAPLSAADTRRLVNEAFGMDEAVTREFTALLYGWTRGNPFFIEQALESLVQSGQLYQREGKWLGWELEEIHLPRSIRDLVLERIDQLAPAARALADLHAVIGTSATYETLHAVSGVEEAQFVEALEELRQAQVVTEQQSGDVLVYDFGYPVVRETLYSELGLARARLLHATVAEALERLFGDTAAAHADELALHFSRAGGGRLAPKATRYLAAAGRSALARFAYREAANYLSAALELADQSGDEAARDPRLLEDLARARQRVGDYEGAIRLWERARADAQRRDDLAAEAAAELRLGLAHHWSGQASAALPHYEAGLRAADQQDDVRLQAELRLARGMSLQEVARSTEAAAELRAALALAERLQDLGLLSRIHRVLLLLHTWTGPPDRAREHGARTIGLSQQTGDRALACSAHWSLAVMEGLSGNLDGMRVHIEEGQRLAEEIRSPLHRIWMAEVWLEYHSATGQWDAALAAGERGIAQARAFHQKNVLPRLLVWSALLYFARGDLERGKRYVDEAWEISGAGEAGPIRDIHTVIPAHTGQVAYHLARGEYAEAVRVGEAGLAIADRCGYTVWAIHRLLPLIGEAYVFLADLQGTARIAARLRQDSERMDHKAGYAWTDASDAFFAWLQGDLKRAVEMLREAVERLEAMQLVPDAARVRRQYAARLRDVGDHEEALRQLRHIHEVFVRLGAERELQKTREQIRELGARPPAREAAPGGVAGLTSREVEIVRLVANRKSNKAIGQALDISARTVSTHLSHIFRKLNVSSRGELAEVARTLELPE
jgi:DNA-binding CsgD family transcriptional regulator/tetratricopeptide (TPR) repeat protein